MICGACKGSMSNLLPSPEPLVAFSAAGGGQALSRLRGEGTGGYCSPAKAGFSLRSNKLTTGNDQVQPINA